MTAHDLPTAAARGDDVAVTPQPCPTGMVPTTHEHAFHVAADRDDVWAWLVDPATFTDSQVWPWRVEFLDPDTGAETGFEEGVVTNHHGPLTNFSGILATVDHEAGYRDLRYAYGAYFLSPRACRPTRLQVWAEPTSSGTSVRLQVEAHVARRLAGASQRFQRVFWRSFERWLTSAVT